MVKPRRKVEFLADFPDDTIYDEAGDEIRFAGKNVAEVVAEMLTARGYEVSVPEHAYELGWEFDGRRKGSRFWIRLTKIDEFVLVTKDMTYRLWPDRGPYVEFLLGLQSALGSDPRLSRIRWFDDGLPADGGEWFPGPVDA